MTGRRNGGVDMDALAAKIRLVDAGGDVRIKEPELCALLGISLKKAQADRQRGAGVRFTKEGKGVFYSLRDVLNIVRQSA